MEAQLQRDGQDSLSYIDGMVGDRPGLNSSKVVDYLDESIMFLNFTIQVARMCVTNDTLSILMVPIRYDISLTMTYCRTTPSCELLGRFHISLSCQHRSLDTRMLFKHHRYRRMFPIYESLKVLCYQCCAKGSDSRGCKFEVKAGLARCRQT